MCCRLYPFLLAGIVSLGAACGPSAPEPAAEAPAPPAPAPALAADPIAGDAIPDRDADPVGFWDYRVEQVFVKRDLNHDGAVSREEFNGDPNEFDKIDANGDGSFTKDELRAHVFSRYVMAPESPAE